MTAAPAPQRPSPSGKPPAGDLRTAEAEVEEAAQRWRLREVGLRERYERRLLLRRGLVEEPRRINGLGVLLDSKHGVSGLLTISSVGKNGSFFLLQKSHFPHIRPMFLFHIPCFRTDVGATPNECRQACARIMCLSDCTWHGPIVRWRLGLSSVQSLGGNPPPPPMLVPGPWQHNRRRRSGRRSGCGASMARRLSGCWRTARQWCWRCGPRGSGSRVFFFIKIGPLKKLVGGRAGWVRTPPPQRGCPQSKGFVVHARGGV